MTMKDVFKRHARKEVGVGGIKCACCGPQTSADRRALRRRCRRRLKSEDSKIKKDE